MTPPKVHTAEEIIGYLEHQSHILLDARPVAAYNGWRLKGEARGGHIAGAKCFPLEWTNYKGWPELLRSKGVTSGKNIVVYGYGPEDTRAMAEQLAAEGYGQVSVFERFLDWSKNPDYPLDHLARYRQLVYPEWVQSLISGRKPPTYDNDKYVICHCSYRYRGDYESGHIPGSIHLDTERLESSKTWNRHSPQELEKALVDHGIDSDTTVILYGRFAHPNNEDEYPGRLAGHLAAMRCAQLMIYAGVKDVRVLNGGMKTWLAAGYETTTDEGKIYPANEFGADIPVNPELIVDLPEAKELLASDDGELVSIRSWEEFIGNVSGYNYIEKAGRIPGAIFGDCGSDAYHMENYRNIDHTMREYHEIADIWKSNGIVPDKHIAFYCGTGWRGSEAFLNAYFMGWPRVSVYDGGWLEWSSDPDNPVETGEPENQSPVWQR
ncbi:thiosulfate sulfurtransferase [candidate division GN15 bacterium]|nr:thiosulfate sulfurtransferase [candidate division GN15 bacterium]